MISLYALTVLALLTGAESFKLSLKPPSQGETRFVQHTAEIHPLPPAPAPVYQEQIREVETSGVKGGQHLQQERLPLTGPLVSPLAPPAQPQLHSLAYLIIRPILSHPQYQYLEPLRQYPIQRPLLAPPLPIRGATKGGEFRFEQTEQVHQQAPTKGSLETTGLRAEEPALPLNQLPIEEPVPEVPVQPVYPPPPPPPKGPGKLMKLKSSLDRFAATAKSKLTLGSTYQVIGEEIVQPPPAPQAAPLPLPLEQQQHQQQEDISLTAQEQESVREAEIQEQQQLKSEPLPKGLAPQREQQQQQVVKQQDKALNKPQLDESFGELKREHRARSESQVPKN